MEIRRATQDDWADLEEAVGVYDQEQRQGYDTVPAAAPLLQFIAAYLEHIWVMRDPAGDFCGFCAWVPAGDEKTLFGCGTWVSPDLRKYGHATELREAAQAYWKAKGYTRVRGTCAKGNEAGFRSVLAMGFETVGYEVEMRL